MSRRAASFLAYVPLQAALLPIGVASAATNAYRQLVVSRSLGVSQTAVEVLNGRYAMHRFGIREDRAAARLVRVLPNASALSQDLALLPLWVKHKISGDYFLYPRVAEEGRESFADLIVARTLFFDEMIRRQLKDAEQLVILGAGFDTRAYGALAETSLQIFEADKAATQSLKRECLVEAGIAHDHVRFVSVDFSRHDVFKKLRDAGYEATRRTVFLWEGVTLYLDEASVRATLDAVRQHSAPGSRILADFYARRFLNLGRVGAVRNVLAFTDESFRFGLDFAPRRYRESMGAFVESNDFTLGDVRYLGGERRFGPFAATVELIRP